MIWKKQPYLGIWTIGLAYIATAVWLKLMPRIGFDATNISMNWVFVFFAIGFGYQVFWELWPFSKMRQPLGGILAGITSIFVSSFIWKLLLIFFEVGDAYSYLAYTQFFIFTYGWFWHCWPFDKMAQPMKGIIFTVITPTFGLIIFELIGPIQESYIFYLPQWLFYFFHDSPIPSETPLKKGFFWTVMILIFSYITYACQIALGFPFETTKGQDMFALAFVFLMFFYSGEGWPFSKLQQPFYGLGICVGTIALTAIAHPIFYGVFNATEWSIVSWCFNAWMFFAILVWFTPPWLVEDEAEENSKSGNKQKQGLMFQCK